MPFFPNLFDLNKVNKESQAFMIWNTDVRLSKEIQEEKTDMRV